MKRDHVLARLHQLHLDVEIPPTSTFYIWLNLEKLPEPLNNGLVRDSCLSYYIDGLPVVLQTFFEELLKEKTIVIPGIFFDINPSHRRNLFHSPCNSFIRISFGPPLADLDKGELILEFEDSMHVKRSLSGLDAIGRVLKKAKKEGMDGFGHRCVFLPAACRHSRDSRHFS